MTGSEFKTALKAAGYTQGQFAEAMGVHRTVIGRQCGADAVDRYWIYALAGLIAARESQVIAALVADGNDNPRK